MEKENAVPKGQVRLYPPEGGGDIPVLAREDQAERYFSNGWTKTKKRAKPAKEENKS